MVLVPTYTHVYVTWLQPACRCTRLYVLSFLSCSLVGECTTRQPSWSLVAAISARKVRRATAEGARDQLLQCDPELSMEIQP
jgi:hypothetical protein